MLPYTKYSSPTHLTFKMQMLPDEDGSHSGPTEVLTKSSEQVF
jgi:hypothetical protein